jgi:hypothetical protein
MSAIRRLSLPLALLTAACASNTSSASADGGAAVRVDNQAAYDMDIFVRQQQGVVRLGFAPGKQVTRLPIPAGFIPGAGLIRFEARPTPNGEVVLSDPFTVRPGDELSWVIPPQ